MCGIAGLIHFDGSPVDPDLLRRLAAALAPRGPDEQTFWIDPDRPTVGLAFARLSILDRQGGRQPMADPARPGRRVVFNGEIYNHRELRRDLQSRGHKFASDHSDTEVLLPLYDERGPDLLHDLRGMFAFAIYDGPAARLFLARDRLGQKPLYWAATPRLFAFASELKALRLVPGLDRELDLAALDLYLQLGYIPSPRTIFRGIQKLSPASRLTVPLLHPSPLRGEGRVRVSLFHPSPSGEGGPQGPGEGLTPTTSLAPETWWSVPPPSSVNAHPADLPALLLDSVSSRLEADVPLGFFLSGGLDSSLVLALARRAAPDRQLRTFSMSFPDLPVAQPPSAGNYDESSSAALMARHVRADHTRLEIAPAALAELLPALVATFDEPFADSSAIPTWLLSQAVRRHVTVALSGDGGDELFAGYDRYHAVRLAAALDRAPLFRLAAWAAGRGLPRGTDLKNWRSRLRRFTDVLDRPPLQRYARWVSPFHEPDPAELYGPLLRSVTDPDAAVAYLAEHLSSGPGSLEDTVAALDARTYLPEDVLTKVDRASMAHGLEVRSPLLDHRLFEAVYPLSAAEKLGPRRQPKWLLRNLARDLLPPEILARPKMGFGVSISAWLAGPQSPWLRRRLSDGPLAASGLIAPDTLTRYVAAHIARQADHGPRLYSLLVLDEFLRNNAIALPAANR